MMQNFNLGPGVTLTFQGAWSQVPSQIEADYSAWKVDTFAPHEAALAMSVHLAPKQSSLNAVCIKTWRSQIAVFGGNRKVQRVLFFDGVHVEYCYTERWVLVQGPDEDQTREAIHYVLNAFLCEYYGERGRNRVHALGGDLAGIGFILLGPSGTGKSTLALELLNNPDFSLISDDTPWTDGRWLWSCGQKISLKSKTAVWPTREFNRFEFGIRYWVEPKQWVCRLQELSSLKVVFIARRQSPKAQVQPASRIQLLWPLVRWLLLGLETPQIFELFLRPTAESVLRKAKILFFRCRSLVRIILTCRVYSIDFGDDPAEAAQTLIRTLHECADQTSVNRLPFGFQPT